MSLFFRGAYRFGFKPWDSGHPAPELVSFVEASPAGKAIDLGCGTGTNSIYLAEHGWDATGIDFVPLAISNAKNKAQSAGVKPRFIVGDVTRLQELGVGDAYGLVFDLGCFHSLPDSGRDAYVRGVTAVAAPAATRLLFCLIRGDRPRRFGPPGISRDEVARRFAAGWDVAGQQGGRPIAGYDAAWYTLHKR